RDHISVSTSSLYMRLSTDNGTTWGPETRITNITDTNDQYDDFPAQIIIEDETLYVLFNRFSPYSGTIETMFMKSLDLGQNWTEPTTLSQVDSWFSGAGGIAVDNERIYVVGDNDSADNEIYLYRSQDGGNTWLPEQRLTNDANGSGSSQIGVDESGVVHMFWTDAMAPGPGIFHITSDDDGVSWSSPSLATKPVGLWGYDTCILGERLHLAWDGDSTGYSEVYYKRSPSFVTGIGIHLVPGWNSLAFPCEPPAGYTTRDLAEDIESDSDMFVLAVCNWTSRQLWQDFVYRKGSSGYPLVNETTGIGNYVMSKNQSYFVLVDSTGPDTVWTPCWPSYTALSCPDWDLHGGWNAVALPFNSTGVGMLQT
ncbi:MAG: exo-alpha-sialidase, partial [Thermoplasmata archaeon]|nr:exo-alpha-sialidase [Thermoplasmata archaeon]